MDELLVTVRLTPQPSVPGSGKVGYPMPDTKADHGVDVVEVTREEGRAILDRAAREALNISGEEFLARWDAGQYEDDDNPAVTRVAMLIPFAR